MNEAAFRFINDTLKSPVLDVIFPLFSDKNLVIIPGVMAAAVAWALGGMRLRAALATLVLAVAIADLGSEKLWKNLYQQSRPYGVLENVNAHRSGEWVVYDARIYPYDPRTSYSFPSSHAANAAAIAAVFAWYRRRSLWLMAPLALMIGVSRIYTGNHFPGDVLAGFAWGAVAGTAAWWGVVKSVNAIKGGEFLERPSPELTIERRWSYAIIGTWTLINFAFVLFSPYTLAGDEAQYWDWSRRLDLGYYSKPPMIAYVIDIFRSAGGNREWAIRSAAVLFTSGSLLLLYGLTQRILKNERAALMAVIAAMAMPALWAGSVLITIDPLLIFFWTLTLYAFHRAVHGGRGMWALTGLALGLGMLSKYTMAILPVALAIYFILWDRKWLGQPGPWLAAAIAVVLNSGVIYWNWRNDWVSVRHTAAIGAPAEWSPVLSLRWLGEFFGAQMGVAGPILFVLVLWAAGVGIRAARDDRNVALLATVFWTLFGFYALVALTRSPEPNWPVCAYAAGVPMLAWWWARAPRGLAMRRVLTMGIILGIGLGALARSAGIVYALATPVEPDSMRLLGLTLDPRRDPANELVGGRELGAALSRHQTAGEFIFSDRYQLAALAAFYTQGRPRTLCANFGDRRYNQYDMWNEWPNWIGRSGLYVSGGDRWRARYFIQHMVNLGAFEDGEPIEEIEVFRGGVRIKQYTISRMYGYTGYSWEPDAALY